MNDSNPSSHSDSLPPRRQRLACALAVCGAALFGAAAPGGQAPAAGAPPHAVVIDRRCDEANDRWTSSLGAPSLYVKRARQELGAAHYTKAARNLRKAATLLQRRLKNAYDPGDRRRLEQDIEALRLTARDVAAGAVTGPRQLDAVLSTTRADVQARGGA